MMNRLDEGDTIGNNCDNCDGINVGWDDGMPFELRDCLYASICEGSSETGEPVELANSWIMMIMDQ